ncbi:MAG: hypothetical protein AAF081_06010 [Actinomycetota bacterium]
MGAIVAVSTSAAACSGGGADNGAAIATTSTVTLAPPSTTTTSTTSITTTTTTTTTTTVPPELAENREAVDLGVEAMLDAPHLSYRSVTESTTQVTGRTGTLLEGTWSFESDTSALWVGFALDDQAMRFLDLAARDDESELTTEEFRSAMSDGIAYDFVDDVVWMESTSFIGGITSDQFPEYELLRLQSDASRTVIEVFDPYRGDWTDRRDEPDGTISYVARMDADRVVPLVAPSSSLQNLLSSGWDAITGQTVEVRAFVAPDGRLAAFEVDQSEWWRAGWDDVGALALIGDDATVTYRFDLAYPDEATVHDAPCTDPTTVVEDGFEVLECASG